jgi:hypothetical protein
MQDPVVPNASPRRKKGSGDLPPTNTFVAIGMAAIAKGSRLAVNRALAKTFVLFAKATVHHHNMHVQDDTELTPFGYVFYFGV